MQCSRTVVHKGQLLLMTTPEVGVFERYEPFVHCVQMFMLWQVIQLVICSVQSVQFWFEVLMVTIT